MFLSVAIPSMFDGVGGYHTSVNPSSAAMELGLDIARVMDVPLHARPLAKNSSAHDSGVRSEDMNCVSLFRLAFDRTPLRLTSASRLNCECKSSEPSTAIVTEAHPCAEPGGQLVANSEKPIKVLEGAHQS